jgi:hypothetical protein
MKSEEPPQPPVKEESTAVKADDKPSLSSPAEDKFEVRINSYKIANKHIVIGCTVTVGGGTVVVATRLSPKNNKIKKSNEASKCSKSCANH